MRNVITQYAEKRGRSYITPEDVKACVRKFGVTKTRLDVLQVLRNITNFGAEDAGLCAFLAWDGRRRPVR